jgi:hypothetical protein
MSEPASSTPAPPPEGFSGWQLLFTVISTAAAAAGVAIPTWNGCNAPAPYFKGEVTINEFELPPSATLAPDAKPLKGYLTLALRSIGTARATAVKLDVNPLAGTAIVKSDGKEVFRGPFTNRIVLGDADLRQSYEVSIWTEQTINRDALTVYVIHSGGEQFLYDKAATARHEQYWGYVTSIGPVLALAAVLAFFYWVSRSEIDELFSEIREINRSEAAEHEQLDALRRDLGKSDGPGH